MPRTATSSSRTLLDPDQAGEPKRQPPVAVPRAGKDNPLAADAASEKIILEWPSGGHNGGCIRFGPDGYLYLATGDGSGIADELQTGQKIGDLLGAILRIDVDRPQRRRKPTRFPPTIRSSAAPDARGEIWSFGHRQVWKFSFDPPTRRLWAGEVGQDLWEMVYLIRRGGNYGWSVSEGTHPFRPNATARARRVRAADRRASAQRLPLDHRRLRLSQPTGCRS